MSGPPSSEGHIAKSMWAAETGLGGFLREAPLGSWGRRGGVLVPEGAVEGCISSNYIVRGRNCIWEVHHPREPIRRDKNLKSLEDSDKLQWM